LPFPESLSPKKNEWSGTKGDSKVEARDHSGYPWRGEDVLHFVELCKEEKADGDANGCQNKAEQLGVDAMTSCSREQDERRRKTIKKPAKPMTTQME
jgi:hypothetical protein